MKQEIQRAIDFALKILRDAHALEQIIHDKLSKN